MRGPVMLVACPHSGGHDVRGVLQSGWVAARCGRRDHSRPRLDEPAARPGTSETAVLAGGCFWGVQGVFQHVKGVSQAVSGYAGGEASTAQYETVGTGTTGHAESVRITYDPTQVTSVSCCTSSSPSFTTRRRRIGRAPTRDPSTDRRFFLRTMSNDGRRRLHRSARKGEGIRRAGRHAHRRGLGLLPGRGLPPGLHGPEPDGALHQR